MTLFLLMIIILALRGFSHVTSPESIKVIAPCEIGNTASRNVKNAQKEKGFLQIPATHLLIPSPHPPKTMQVALQHLSITVELEFHHSSIAVATLLHIFPIPSIQYCIETISLSLNS
jgi:hypothetical protein